MIINRRTYYVNPGQFRPALTLMKEILKLTKEEFNQDFKILTPIYGSFGTIVVEFEFTDTAEQDKFSAIWYPKLEEKGWIVQWFQYVQSGTNELWTDSREPEPFKETKAT